MNKFFTGIGSIMLVLCVVTACKEKESQQAGSAPVAADAAKGTHAAATGTPADHKPAADVKATHIKVDSPHIPATTADSAALYCMFENSGADDKLVAVAAEGVKAVEIHETVMEGDVAKMMPMKDLQIHAGKSVALAKGGMHIMLMGLPSGGLKEGSHVKVTFKFEKSGDMVMEVPVVAAEAHASHHDHK